MDYLDPLLSKEIRKAARIANVSVAALARASRIRYARLLRLLNGERRAKDGEVEAVLRSLDECRRRAEESTP